MSSCGGAQQKNLCLTAGEKEKQSPAGGTHASLPPSPSRREATACLASRAAGSPCLRSPSIFWVITSCHPHSWCVVLKYLCVTTPTVVGVLLFWGDRGFCSSYLYIFSHSRKWTEKLLGEGAKSQTPDLSAALQKFISFSILKPRIRITWKKNHNCWQMSVLTCLQTCQTVLNMYASLTMVLPSTFVTHSILLRIVPINKI